jgi:hypothetical protein
MSAIRIRTKLTVEQYAALTEYLRGEVRLTRAQWRRMREAANLLGQSTIAVQERNYTFTQFYEAFIDRQFANGFLQTLVTTGNVTQDAPHLQAGTARQIVQWMQGQEFYQKGSVESRLLLAFCLYWWGAFAVGYAFEVEIFHDLQATGVVFAGHDITNRAERMSAFDLPVLGLRGDVKYSTYFLTAEEGRTEGIDFFITRLYDEAKVRWLRVVFLTPAAWEAIDGDTLPATLESAASVLPAAVLLHLATATFVLVLYDDWKSRVLACQAAKGSEFDGRKDDSEYE